MSRSASAFQLPQPAVFVSAALAANTQASTPTWLASCVSVLCEGHLHQLTARARKKLKIPLLPPHLCCPQSSAATPCCCLKCVFIYFWLHWVSGAAHGSPSLCRAFLRLWGVEASLHCGPRASPCFGFPCRRAQALECG